MAQIEAKKMDRGPHQIPPVKAMTPKTSRIPNRESNFMRTFLDGGSFRISSSSVRSKLLIDLSSSEDVSVDESFIFPPSLEDMVLVWGIPSSDEAGNPSLVVDVFVPVPESCEFGTFDFEDTGDFSILSLDKDSVICT